MDIFPFFAASIFAVSGTGRCKADSSNSSDTDCEHAVPLLKKVCREEYWPLTSKRKY